MVGWIVGITVVIWLILGLIGLRILGSKNYLLWLEENIFFLIITGPFALLTGLWLPYKEPGSWLSGDPPDKDILYCHYLRFEDRKLKGCLGTMTIGFEGFMFRLTEPAVVDVGNMVSVRFAVGSGINSHRPTVSKIEYYFPFKNIKEVRFLKRRQVLKGLRIRYRMIGRSSIVLKVTMEGEEQKDEYFWSHSRHFESTIRKKLLGENGTGLSLELGEEVLNRPRGSVPTRE